MSKLFGSPQPQKKDDSSEQLRESRNMIRAVRTGSQVIQDLKSSDPQRAAQRAIAAGLKLSSSNIFYDEGACPIRLLDALQKFGPEVLTWEPEALMATIDQKFGGWTPEKAAQAIETFNLTGFIQTDVPPLVRQKIYAIRIAATSDAPYSEWNVFEKVGSVFNDRVAQFSVIEPLSTAECVRTVGDLIKIRPDHFTDEVNIYIAACCHEDGFYTVSPIREIQDSDKALQQMNYEATGEKTDRAIADKIIERYNELKKNAHRIESVPDDSLIEVQARKLLSLDSLL